MKMRFIGTAFQKKVWDALRDIPYGEVSTYAEIAANIGQSAVRTMVAANGRNSISIIALCRRVIGSSGQLIGFTGRPVKETLRSPGGVSWARSSEPEIIWMAGSSIS
ncbi:methylated-DNA--[protein]-cysteine S-methyltransferase [Paraburkholderia sp. 2C]